MIEYTKTLRSKLRVFEWASVAYTSALTGQRIQKVLTAGLALRLSCLLKFAFGLLPFPKFPSFISRLLG
jgi:predicted GTPase